MIEPIHPWMLAGTAMGSAPIIIHLLNRQRYKKVTWAAMHWLLAAFKKSARRLQIEDLILLIIRILILVLLALALARMVLHEGGGIFGGKSALHRVIVLDTSFSMGYSPGGKTSFDRAKEVARQLASKTELSAGDQVTLIAMTDQPGVRIKASSDLNAVYRDVDTVELSQAGTDVIRSLTRAIRLLGETESPRREIFLITDLQRSGWIETQGVNEGRMRNLDELNKAVEEYKNAAQNRGLPPIYLVDVGVKDAQNLAVVDLESDSPIIAAKDLVGFKARVRNYTDKTLNDLPVSLNVDGERVAASVIQKLEPGREGAAAFSYQFEVPGPHWVSAAIENDRLAVDDTRPLAVPVIESLKLLAVDGEIKPSAPLESETGLLLRALAPKVPQHWAAQGVRSPSIITTNAVSDEALNEVQFEGQDLVVLANVPTLPEDKAAQLRRFVREGGAVLIFLGDRVDPGLYNEILYSAKDPLLPAKLTVTKGEAGRPDAAFVALQPDASTDAVMPNIGRSFHNLFQQVRVFKHYRCEVAEAAKAAPGAEPGKPPAEKEKAQTKEQPATAVKGAEAADNGKDKEPDKDAPPRSVVHVALRYADGDPAIVIREYGQGKVALVTTTADKHWNDLPEHRAYLPLMHELVYHLVRPRSSRHNLEVGGTFSMPWPPEDSTKEVAIVPPEGHEEEKTSKRPDKIGLFTYAGPQDLGVRWAGPYKLVVAGEDRPRELFAAQLPAAESNLARIEPEEIARNIKEPSFVVIADPEKLGDTVKGKVVGREFWRTLAWTVLALAVAETFLAWLFGRNRW